MPTKNAAAKWDARLPLQSWILRQSKSSKSKAPDGRVFVVGAGTSLRGWLERQPLSIAKWQLNAMLENQRKEIFCCASSEGPIWVIQPAKAPVRSLSNSDYGRLRDLCGTIVLHEEFRQARTVEWHFVGTSSEERSGALVGLELAAYQFKDSAGQRLPPLDFPGTPREELEKASAIGIATNIARHLTNLPPAELQPESYARLLHQHFSKRPHFKVEIWDHQKLSKEGHGLHVAVGQAAEHPAVMVRLSYHPKAQKSHIALVGKGITFDSGGLDLKPASGMRWMKKDMAGSGSLVGFAHWLSLARPQQNYEIYLALAENSVASQAFRPGDILKSRNGQSVEIHNTDAEGRLVLADTIELARTHKPTAIINLATLTGAMRVALGTDVAGYFSNHEELSSHWQRQAQKMGEKAWRMPLVKEYEAELKSSVADLSNASSSGFGGAITAALFLERFVGETPWIHVDMYGWTDRPQGALTEPGGNGQMVQTLVAFTNDPARLS